MDGGPLSRDSPNELPSPGPLRTLAEIAAKQSKKAAG